MMTYSVTLIGTPGNGICGIGEYTDQFGEWLEKKGTNVCRIAINYEGRNPIHFFKQSVNAIRERNDVIHVQYHYSLFGPHGCWTPVFFLPLLIASRFLNHIVVVTLHDLRIPEEVDGVKALGAKVLNWALSLCSDQLIFLAEDVAEKSHFQERQYSVLPHGSDSPREYIKREAKEYFGYDVDDTVIAEVGYLRQQKGNHMIAEVAEKFPDTDFLLAGGIPDDGSSYRDKIEEISGKNVQITGILSEEGFHKAFRAADILVLPYTVVSQSGILNWAMAYETPTIASDLPRFTSLHEEYDCLELFETDSKESLTETISFIKENKHRQAELEQGAKQYKQTNSFKTKVEKTLELYGKMHQ